ncbi:hypothetical protein ACQP3L_33885, partial [Escherichia coli]
FHCVDMLNIDAHLSFEICSYPVFSKSSANVIVFNPQNNSRNYSMVLPHSIVTIKQAVGKLFKIT